jgi:hypothetical protein
MCYFFMNKKRDWTLLVQNQDWKPQSSKLEVNADGVLRAYNRNKVPFLVRRLGDDYYRLIFTTQQKESLLTAKIKIEDFYNTN